MSYADKLYNLRDLTDNVPEDWSDERVQQYYEWSGKVVRNMLGANEKLEAKLEEVLNIRGVSLYQ